MKLPQRGESPLNMLQLFQQRRHVLQTLVRVGDTNSTFCFVRKLPDLFVKALDSRIKLLLEPLLALGAAVIVAVPSRLNVDNGSSVANVADA